MKFKVNEAAVKALSLSGVTAKVGDEVEFEVIEKALGVSISETEKAKVAQKAAEDALGAEKAKPAATPERLLSVDAKAAPYFVEARTQRVKALSATLDAAQSKGKINAAMRTSFEKILSVRHGYALSEAGAAEAVAVADLAESLLAAIPDQAVVPVGERLKQEGAQGAGGRAANDAGDFDAVKEADALLARTGLAAKK